MMLQAVVRTSWIFFLLFSIGASSPVRKGRTGSGYGSYLSSGILPGYSSSSGSYSGVSSRINHGRSFDERLALMINDMMHLGPNRVSMESHWNVDHIPLGMIQEPDVVYPSSHVIHSNSGYQRARDSHTDSKYTTETFGDIYVPGVPHDHHDRHPGTGSHWPQKTR